MQPILTRQTTMIGLTAAAIAFIAVLIYVSAARDFLPGIVELASVLSVALIFGIIIFVPRGSRQAMQRCQDNVRVGRIGFVAAKVAVLALTAALLPCFLRVSRGLLRSFSWCY